jgi:hypothetical protein
LKKTSQQAAIREFRQALRKIHPSISVSLGPVARVLHAHGVCAAGAMWALSASAESWMFTAAVSVGQKFGINLLTNKKAANAFVKIIREEAAKIAASRMRWAEQVAQETRPLRKVA